MELFTVGYEGRTLPDVVQILGDNEVERLVDVRERPFSRKKGFSLVPLSEALRKATIDYTHQAELGNPEQIRILWKEGQVSKGRERYRALLLNGRSESLEWLVSLVPREVVCLFCLEADPLLCHRSLIAEELVRLKPNIVIRHL